jgi:hypothetical protein
MVSCRRRLLPVGQKCGAKLHRFYLESNSVEGPFDEAGLDFDEVGWKLDGLVAWGFVKFFPIPI